LGNVLGLGLQGYQILNNNKMSPKEKASEIYESISNELSKHIFSGHHDIAIILSEKQAKEVLESFNEYYPYSIETKDMKWTSDDSWLFDLYKKYWESVINELRLLA
jgi:hypothetical protein